MGMVLYHCKKLYFAHLPVLAQQRFMHLLNIKLRLTVAKVRIISWS